MPTDFVQVQKEVQSNAAKLSRAHPDAMAAFSDLGKAIYTDGVLSAKMKELIALAIGVTVRCDGCLGHHAKACLQFGASREEVVEAIGVAVHMGGGPSMVYGSEALNAFDQHVANGK
jgi:AhpD family alkylhydroperoxidase